MPDDTKVSVVGLGRLGLPLAAVLASRGLHVIGVDRDVEHVTRLNSGVEEIHEPGLSALLQQAEVSFTAATSIEDAVLVTDVTFVIVDTPRTEHEVIGADSICEVMNEIGKTLARKTSRQLIVLVSTSYPGSVSERVIPSLERDGKLCGIDFDFCYSPEFVALGDAVRGFHDPEFTLIGEFDSRSGDRLEAIYQMVHGHRTSHVRMDLISAEIAKLALNFCLVAKVSCANFLAQICEKAPGARIDRITGLVSMDQRIGRGFLKGGMPYGGKCLPRDIEAMTRLADTSRIDSALPRAMASLNDRRFDDLLQLVRERARFDANGRPIAIAILGLSFKADTDETAGSAGMFLIEKLNHTNGPLLVYDPAVRLNAALRVQQVAVAADCIAAGNVVVLTTPWKEFLRLPPALFRGKHVVDGWRILTEAQQEACLSYAAVGVAPC